MTLNMRCSISLVAALVAILACARPMIAADRDFILQQAGKGVWVAIAPDSGRAGGNAGFIVGEDSIAVVDTFEHEDAARDFLAEIRKISALPIRFVINTHYHLDHVSGNDVFANAGAVVLAHRNVRTWMQTENFRWWGDAIKPEDRARVLSLKLPDAVYDEGIDLFLGKRTVQVRFLRGHTGGDSIVRVPDAKITFCGDLLWTNHVPNLVDASTAPWIDTLNRLHDNYADFVFVPGHGEIASGPDVITFRDYLVGLRKAIQELQGQGKTDDVLVGAILPTLRKNYGGWGFFDDFARDNIRQTAQELAGHKRLPQPRGGSIQ